MHEELIPIEREFLSVPEAMENAFKEMIEKNKMEGAENSSVYIWRQRYNQGKLSHKKINEILEEAGFKKVVEEKWIFINKSKRIPQPTITNERNDRGKKQVKAPRRVG